MASPATEPEPSRSLEALADRVSVVICSKDRRALLEKAVASVRECDELGAVVEIVVVEETDKTAPIPGTRRR